MGQARFDQGAETWDEQPGRVQMAEGIASAILAQVPVRETMSCVDYGCGTGLVTLAILPHVRHVTGIDSSANMLARLREKTRGLTNVDTLHLDLEVDSPPAIQVDLVFSAMTFHHIADVPRVLQALAGMLVPGGFLAVADLDAEDGSFHQNMTGIHHSGFERAWVKAQMQAAGLDDLCESTACEVERERPEGMRKYPVFLIFGRKEDKPDRYSRGGAG